VQTSCHVFTIVNGNIDHDDGLVVEGALERGHEIRRAFDPVALRAKGLCIFHEVRVGEADIPATAETTFLMPFDQSVFAVIPDHDHECELMAKRCFDFLRVHHKSGIAGNGENATFRIDQLGGQRTWQCDAHGGETV